MSIADKRSWYDKVENEENSTENDISDEDLVKRIGKTRVTLSSTSTKQQGKGNRKYEVKLGTPRILEEIIPHCDVCGEEETDKDILVFAEIRYGFFKTRCQVCIRKKISDLPATIQDTAKVFPAKCDLCKTTDDIQFIQFKDGLFKNRCLRCCSVFGEHYPKRDK